MQIKLYRTTSDEKVCNKILTNETTKNITIKDVKNFENPVFYIQNNLNLNLYNYCYIPDWDIYYYIVDKGRETGQRNIIYCSVDPRKTMYSEIKASSGIVRRQVSGNKYIPDRKAQQMNDIKIRTIPFSTADVATTSNSYVLTIGGASTS